MLLTVFASSRVSLACDNLAQMRPPPPFFAGRRERQPLTACRAGKSGGTLRAALRAYFRTPCGVLRPATHGACVKKAAYAANF